MPKVLFFHRESILGSLRNNFSKKFKFTPKSLVLNKIWLRILGFLTDSIEKAWIRMFWSIKIIRIGPKPSKIAKYILGRFPSFFRFILENLIFRGFFNFLVSLLEGIFEISPDRPCSPPYNIKSWPCREKSDSQKKRPPGWQLHKCWKLRSPWWPTWSPRKKSMPFSGPLSKQPFERPGMLLGVNVTVFNFLDRFWQPPDSQGPPKGCPKST